MRVPITSMTVANSLFLWVRTGRWLLRANGSWWDMEIFWSWTVSGMGCQRRKRNPVNPGCPSTFSLPPVVIKLRGLWVLIIKQGKAIEIQPLRKGKGRAPGLGAGSNKSRRWFREVQLDLVMLFARFAMPVSGRVNDLQWVSGWACFRSLMMMIEGHFTLTPCRVSLSGKER